MSDLMYCITLTPTGDILYIVKPWSKSEVGTKG